jgi:photosystem II stability/assembly factor-like uncharacterized protein
MWKPFVVLAASQTVESACLIEGASAAGESVWAVCKDGKVLFHMGLNDGWSIAALPSEATPRNVAFLDAKHGFVVGDRGMLLATEDGGKTGRQVEVPAQENLTAVFFRGEHGWVAGWGGVILHTADGGRSWENQRTRVANGLEGIYFLDASLGWAVGWMGTILGTAGEGKAGGR